MLIQLKNNTCFFFFHNSTTLEFPSNKFFPDWIPVQPTCISWMMALNCGERSVHCLSSSMALSKFFTYSAYILRKGVSFCRMSPMRGVDDLQGQREGGKFVTVLLYKVGYIQKTIIFVIMSPAAEAHHSPMRFSRSGSRNWLWKAWMETMLEKMFFTTSTGKVPLLASSISLAQNTWEAICNTELESCILLLKYMNTLARFHIKVSIL